MLNKKIAVYGTLRKGHGNWDWFLNRAEPLKTVKLSGYKLGVYGLPFCEETKNKGDETVFEIYEVDEQSFKQIQILEGGYDESIMEIDNEEITWWQHYIPVESTITTDYTAYITEIE